jgi:hypothetical protein
MKQKLILFSLLSIAATALGFLSVAQAQETSSVVALSSTSEAGSLQALQNPVKGKVMRLPQRPSSVGFEQNTLGIAVQATRTSSQGQVQTEFHLQNIPALPGELYAPQALQRAVFTLNGLAVELTPQNQWLVAFPADLLERSNTISLEVYGAGGVLVSSLSNRIGL